MRQAAAHIVMRCETREIMYNISEKYFLCQVNFVYICETRGVYLKCTKSVLRDNLCILYKVHVV